MNLLYTQFMEKQPISPRWWDSLTAGLLLAALLTSATRLYSTEWTSFLERVQYLTLLGGIAGLALGYSRFTPRVAKWIGFGYTLFVIPWQLGYTLSGNLDWNERLNILGWRIGGVINQLIEKKPFNDSILFFTLMALLFWIIAIVAGYYITRHGQAWPAIIPAGIALIIIDHFDPHLPSAPRYLLFFLFFGLIIVGRLTYLRYRAEWDAQGVMRAPGAGADIGRAALAAVVVLVMFAWVAPASGSAFNPASELWVKLNKPWESMRTRFQDVFSSLQSSVGVVTDFYGSNLTLGTGTHLGNDVVFTVTTPNLPPKGSQYYWQARTYDHYDGAWTSTIKDAKSYGNLGITLTYPSWSGRAVADFTITSQVTLLNTIYAPPLPMWVSRSGTAAIQSLPGDMEDLSYLSANPPIHAGDTYQVHAWISDPTQAMLRQSSTTYPDWIKQKYLQLPPNLSPKYKELAQNITEGLSNDYDKVAAVTSYLRRTITYSETIDPAPPGKDPLEYFLFEARRGYCNYYATAEVILLRTLGIPTRMAVGFAQGQLNSQTVGDSSSSPTKYTYTVRYKESHAWPEVYFTNAGWVEFEPTVSQSARLLPAGSNDPVEPLNNLDPDRLNSSRGLGGVNGTGSDPVGSAFQSITHSQPAQIAIAILMMLGIILAVVIAFRVRRSRVEIPILPVWAEEKLRKRGLKVPAWLHRWARRSLFSPLERSYGVVNQALGLLGRPAKPSQTPSERVAVLGTVLPESLQPAQVVLREYQNAQYSPYPGNAFEARQASDKVRRMAWKAWFAKLFARFNNRGRGW